MAGDDKAEEKAVYRVLINAPIETVWSELVKTDEVLPFFFGAVCQTENGLVAGEPMAIPVVMILSRRNTPGQRPSFGQSMKRLSTMCGHWEPMLRLRPRKPV